MNPTGLLTALSAFLGIWLGHVGVRAIERNSPELWKPALLLASSGLGLEILALFLPSPFNFALAILGITLLWDTLELFRQEKRVRKGHAPANPANPRHARLLSESPSATTEDLLERSPRQDLFM
ncbi:MAG: DUF4491 family protein [Anaerolineales bacterium]